MGRKYKKKLPLRPPKRIPTVFQCPRCGRKAVRVELEKDSGKARVSCGSCKIYAEIEIPPICGAVDAYGKFVDLYYEGKLEEEKESE
ncbi:MAG: transcription elongation factor [Candidatus Methanomethylicota archaeon]|uniref:Transcription elongation factor n=1 Tax=Thermoproteota archaeon TaxID=2056631 RepID=A0A497F7E7_9CREN|nr:MAG: transcription elongation factor [Candidatus Verstraetearchaeota archaeon]